MSYEQVRQDINARFDHASAPRTHGTLDGLRRDPAAAIIYGTLLFHLVDDREQAIANLEQLCQQTKESEVYTIYKATLAQVRSSI